MNGHFKPETSLKEPRRLVTAFAFIGIAVLMGGLAIAWLPRGSGFLGLQPVTDPKIDPRAHARQLGKAEIETRFQQGVVMLHAKQYEYALAAFQRVLKLDPEMPEAHVNMGYALLGLERYSDAAEAFDKATLLRPNQANAYWGLAIALERSGNLRGARDPMMTFVHLTKPGDPYRDKALATLAEWEKKIDQQEREMGQELAAVQKKSAKQGSKTGVK